MTEHEFDMGDRVFVNPDKWDATPAWEGTIVNYWRNGCWIVREPARGTTAAYNGERLELVR